MGARIEYQGIHRNFFFTQAFMYLRLPRFQNAFEHSAQTIMRLAGTGKYWHCTLGSSFQVVINATLQSIDRHF